MMDEKIIQLVPWRDLIFALTDRGRIFRLIPERDTTGFIFALTCEGLPRP